MSKPVIIIGGGDHGAVVADVLLLSRRTILGVADPALSPDKPWHFGIPVLGDDDVISGFSPDSVELVNGIGFLPRSQRRQQIFQQWQSQGYGFSNVVHPAATIGREVAMEDGVQIMAAAVINVRAMLRANCIINTAAVIEHDVIVGQHCHVAPGAIICGGSQLGEACFIGANATVIHYQTLKANTTVPAGGLVNDCRYPSALQEVRS